MNLLFETTKSEPLLTSSGSSVCDRQGLTKTRSSPDSLLMVAATGLGKTAIMAGLAKHWPTGRVMLLSHRFELNMQAVAELERVCGEAVDLEQAEYFADRRANPHRIVVASVQTLNATRKGKYRMERFRPEEFGLILIDEAHHSTAASYRRVINYFRDGNPDTRVVGVTATPDRLDGSGMGHVFADVGCDYNLLWGIKNGWLVEPQQKFVRVDGLDMSQIKTVGGDLDTKQLAKLVEGERMLHQMAEPIVDICGTDQQSIVFTASVPQAHRLAEMILDYRARKYGDRARVEAIDGSWTPQDPRRKDVVRKFKNQEIQYLVNCGIATEGFDAPSVRVIAIGRPTKSRALYQQMLGRGTRPLPGVVDGADTPEERRDRIAASGKPSCTVIDFVGQSGRHKLVCSTDILAGDAPDDVIERAKSMQAKNGFKRSTLEAIMEARQAIETEREAKRLKVTVGVKYTVIDAGYDAAELPKVSCPGYMQKNKPTEKQQKFMLKLGFTQSQIDGMNPRAASAAIDYAIKNPRTGFAKWISSQKSKQN